WSAEPDCGGLDVRNPERLPTTGTPSLVGRLRTTVARQQQCVTGSLAGALATLGFRASSGRECEFARARATIVDYCRFASGQLEPTASPLYRNEPQSAYRGR